MLKETINLIQAEVNAKRLYQSVKEVSCHHRIQASSGYRDAANHCLNYLHHQGIAAQILQYPANKTDYAGTYKLFQEWQVKEAYCDVVYPKQMRIADFQMEPISIIQKIYSCDYRKNPVDVVLMDKGCDPANYEDIDVHGKLLFIHEHFDAYQWALKAGALGFISDFINVDDKVRNRSELYNVLNYTSFWWKHTEDELPAFGFVLSPQSGDELTAMALSLQEDYHQGRVSSPYIQVCPYIDSQLFDGYIDVVEATIPGKSEECILITAHLCHPCASANDNASGVAGAMEVMRCLSQLQKTQKLPLFEKTIKMILIPEFTGTYCYLSDGRDLSNYLAGINLDMIGGRQQDMYGPITITNLPLACPSFVDSLATFLASMLSSSCDNKEAFQMSLVHQRDVPFQLGSDHFILSDPMVNIPSIMLGQWPDKYYHTSGDTLENIDPIVLKYATVLACNYVYALANYDETMTSMLLKHMRLQFIKTMNAVDHHQEDAYENIYHFFMNANTSLAQFAPSQSYDILQEQTHITQLYHMYTNNTLKHDTRYPQVPVRLFQTPIVDLKDVIIFDNVKLEKLEVYQKDHPIMAKEHALLQVLCDYYVDGKRTIDEIARAVIAEAGYGNLDDIYAYIMFMCDIQLMSLIV